MRFLFRPFTRFLRDERGTVLVEAVLVLPFLMWGYVATFVYFDAFLTQTINLKSAYTIADLISRQVNVLKPADIEGMKKVYDFLNKTKTTGESGWIRVSDIYWDDTNKVYKVSWSYATDGQPILTNQTINNYASRLPKLAIGDTEIVVETSLTYTPAFNVGISPRTFSQFVVTRPRMAPDVKFSSS
ncbi:TadE/TadG family type IV pilus assembly protein [Acidimangrovimonas pyrenivorans]|uniref:TadE/TadG family type IV pilus assembly protein n=1 Tax=Acidimangrovimonas pyrenivorans TaxID=2030798 RepID=A0ABV7AH83_9RHOB